MVKTEILKHDGDFWFGETVRTREWHHNHYENGKHLFHFNTILELRPVLQYLNYIFSNRELEFELWYSKNRRHNQSLTTVTSFSLPAWSWLFNARLA